MKVHYDGFHYRVWRGRDLQHARYFCFFVDHDSAAWSKSKAQALTYSRAADAAEAIEELKRRNRIRSVGRKKAGVK